jgi:hypothetical protein
MGIGSKWLRFAIGGTNRKTKNPAGFLGEQGSRKIGVRFDS